MMYVRRNTDAAVAVVAKIRNNKPEKFRFISTRKWTAINYYSTTTKPKMFGMPNNNILSTVRAIKRSLLLV